VLEYDEIRTQYLESDGITVYRFLNSDIENGMKGVLIKIEQEIQDNIL